MWPVLSNSKGTGASYPKLCLSKGGLAIAYFTIWQLRVDFFFAVVYFRPLSSCLLNLVTAESGKKEVKKGGRGKKGLVNR